MSEPVPRGAPDHSSNGGQFNAETPGTRAVSVMDQPDPHGDGDRDTDSPDTDLPDGAVADAGDHDAGNSGELSEDELTEEEILDQSLSKRLIEAIDSLKVSAAAATKIISVADNPNASAKDLAAAIELDPTFTAHIMRLANSAYYGMSGRIGNANFAVTVIGFSTVRSLATLSATGMSDQDDKKPDGFWKHAAATAAAASVVSKQFGVPSSDAFAAGLMHDLGSALLHSIDVDAHTDLINRYGTDGAALNDAERRTFGIGHDEAVGRILSHWHLPTAFVEAVRIHHNAPLPDDPPFVRALRAADLLAEMAFSTRPHLHSVELLSIGISQKDQNEIAAQTRDRSAEILAGLPV